jgi:hypothetical protein
MNNITMLKEIIYLTIFFELLTIITRLIFGSAKKFYKARKIPHIHHLFFGIICLFFFQYWYFLEIGISLILADLIHHFIVLPIWIKKTEFP